jgi:hypothetical protein
MPPMTRLTCRCGACRIEVWGPPIQTVDCHCTSCRDAAARIAALPGAVDERSPHGGVPYVMQRKDRMRLVAGEGLAAARLTPDARTVRAIATCCNSHVYTEFRGGHWLSLHAARFPDGQRPAPTLRTMTGDDPAGDRLPHDIPNARRHSVGFMWRLLRAWAAMRFRAPALSWATRDIPLG